MTRLGIINNDKCKPTKCGHECKKVCPENAQGKLCVEIETVAKISNELCIGCGLCVKKCPFHAIQIVKLPSEMNQHLVHTYGENMFRIYKFPILKKGKIIGLLGPNGIGKTTMVNILSNKIKPNFNTTNIITDKDIIKQFRGSETHKYFTELYSDKLKVVVKPQDLDKFKKSKINVLTFLNHYKPEDCDNDFVNEIIDVFDLSKLFDNNLNTLSGGERQRLIISICMLQKADVYIFDEPCNYLDIKQRLLVAKMIKRLSNDDNRILVIEHDVMILDFMSDFIHILFGKPAAYGVSSLPYNTGEAINMYFDGYIRPEKILIRDEEYNMNFNLDIEYDVEDASNVPFESTTIKFNNFQLDIKSGFFPNKAGIILILGQNGVGKTTFVRHLMKSIGLSCSYKPQHCDDLPDITVSEFLFQNIKESLTSSHFTNSVIKPFNIETLMDNKLKNLSGGELQRVMITSCIGKDADVYLIDEPSASLDIEYRIQTTKILKRFLLHSNKVGFVVEHDITMSLNLAKDCQSKVIFIKEDIIEDGIKFCSSTSPLKLSEGMNLFLKDLDVTFRKDRKDRRHRINKHGSSHDQDQKKKNIYYV
jgi:ATP-binding cassette subfamily E protein 1